MYNMELEGKIKEAMNSQRFWEFMAEEMERNDAFDGSVSLKERAEVLKKTYSLMPDQEVKSLFAKAFERLHNTDVIPIPV